MSKLFESFCIRSVRFKNRIFLSPMCMYSAEEGFVNEWHLVHLGSRAVGGVSLVMVEATAVSPEGRITPFDSGIWSDRHIEPFIPIVNFISKQGAVAGIQIAHAGRKASTDKPWFGGAPVPPERNGWIPIAPSPIPFDALSPTPIEMTHKDIHRVEEDFARATQRARKAGFQVLEIHMAHGYLLHEFLSPLSNKRTDEFGGSLENRMRFPLIVAKAVRSLWPQDLPVFVRISASDWHKDGWDLEQSISFCHKLKEIGVDLIDCSSGGLINVPIPVGSNYQVPFSASIRKQVGIMTGAVGMITDPWQAEGILSENKADCVFLARELLREPYWVLKAANALGVKVSWPAQYLRARPS
ncbi:NADH:flavin oxidoreductase/NADH oxidase [Candidatus Methylacidiphilum fumarolicum]|uniref:NADPH dehydrogenase n=2 Tax=Candidatus Methylacidiphilum fumarolicum TaxID=591154 RepID=I0JZQ1_METFB|nr:NADH:flavin oxidoreductase/NADH oxidase [Candidatus Methylacidiphilum fumarolicum]MBW6415862.1 NADH:flavin oxidoreductase/NADH oxidase [Candidatus Methylacidiphilum fumarolicum]TFE67681.1 oxidoreductase [Candidatus Methylacidiphilum fumarolicum]TFE72430.1 NADH:flavin oxidoreductase/NADH oxidase [Candidatus Methylacidiphilum fumarolicum]TFE72448.1 NADH:flavin oxidoreductase/NADH oxidase [Candidatus Methylacidiphilum fumarolicum]TFE77805.1 oxidoreductase [Candidatus Methylacidiphilum fumaroli